MTWIRADMHSPAAKSRRLPKLCRNPTLCSLPRASFLLLRVTNSFFTALRYFFSFCFAKACFYFVSFFFKVHSSSFISFCCFFVVIFFSLGTLKRELCSPQSPVVYPIILHPSHIHPVQTWASPPSYFPQPPLSMMLFLLHPSPFHLILCWPP